MAADETPGRVAATLAAIRADIEETATVYNLDGVGKNSYPVSAFMCRHARSLLKAAEDALELHHPKPLYGLAFALNSGKPLCAHDPDSDHDAHFEADDGLWYCRDEITGRACVTCAEEDAADLWAEWPCPTYLAITAALAGTQPSEDENRA